MKPHVRRRLIVFALISAVAVTYAGARYARLTDRFLPTQYHVHVELPTSGGLYEGAEVTYRGVPVGRVDHLTLDAAGVVADLAIGNRWQIPDPVTAGVHNRSAVGEQYLDLTPERSGPPFLTDGSRIAPAHTSTPLQEETLLASLDAFVGSIDPRDLTTVVAELGHGFQGSGDDLGAILDGSARLVDTANAHLPQTLALLDNTTTVLRSQQAGASDLRTFARGLALVSTTIRTSGGDIRKVIDRGGPAAAELGVLVNELGQPVPGLLGNLRTLLSLAGDHLPGLAQVLSIFPWEVAMLQPATREGRAHLTLTLSPDPLACQRGYIPPGKWRSTQDLSSAKTPYDVGCQEPGKNWRGSQHAK